MASDHAYSLSQQAKKAKQGSQNEATTVVQAPPPPPKKGPIRKILGGAAKLAVAGAAGYGAYKGGQALQKYSKGLDTRASANKIFNKFRKPFGYKDLPTDRKSIFKQDVNKKID